MNCKQCGAGVSTADVFCPNCGCRLVFDQDNNGQPVPSAPLVTPIFNEPPRPQSPVSDKSGTTVLILCILGFFGLGGIHDFYLGKGCMGVLKLFTLNWFGIGTLIDLILICTGSYKDKNGIIIKL